MSNSQSIQISNLSAGATGYVGRKSKNAMSEEQVLNELADDGIEVVEAEEFLSSLVVPNSFRIPKTLNTLEWWKVFNQGSIGSCLGCSDCQTATGVHWLSSGGHRVEFSKFGHYILTQKIGRMFGQDVGSVPTDALKVAAKYGYCPEVWSAHLEAMYATEYGEPSGLKPHQKLLPGYPNDYRSGLQTFRGWLRETDNSNGKLRRIMAMFKMKKFVRISKAEQIVKAKTAGVGFVQQSSLWPSAMDQHPTRIDRFMSRITNQKHGGGHAYQIMDLTRDGEFVLGNTWSSRWGDDGAKTVSPAVEQEIIDHKFSIAFLKTHMDMPPLEPKVIPNKASDWF